MEIIRGIRNVHLSMACTILSVVFFLAGGVAFNQSAFYGAVFIVLALVLFCMSVFFRMKKTGR